MNLWQSFWGDEQGAILTAEAVLIGSVAVLGSVVGLSAASNAVNDELTEMASAIRSLDQSYVIQGRSSCGAWTAGSYYIQPRVEESLQELCGEGELDVAAARDEIDVQRDRIYPAMTEDAPAPNELPPKKARVRKDDDKQQDAKKTDAKQSESRRKKKSDKDSD